MKWLTSSGCALDSLALHPVIPATVEGWLLLLLRFTHNNGYNGYHGG
jgi:hypothetical protein